MSSRMALAMALLPLSARDKKILSEHCTREEAFTALTRADLYAMGVKSTAGRDERLTGFLGEDALEQAEEYMHKLLKRGVQVITLFDREYPPLLREVYAPPLALYCRGTLPNPRKPALGVIGTRKATLQGKQETAFFVRECCKALGSIVSGLAMGIDGAAHRAALAEGAHTTAVLGCGFDRLYPSSHRGLAARIIDEGGLLLSQYPPHTSPTQYFFPERNHIISGMSRGVIVIEAPLGSGALITVSAALEQGRDVFVHSVGLDEVDSGTRGLREQGALTLNRGEDLLALWSLSTPGAPQTDELLTAEKPTSSPKSGRSSSYDIGKSLANKLWDEIGGNLDGIL